MPRWLTYTVLICVLGYIITFEGPRLHASIVSLFLAAVGVGWLFSGHAQMPKNSVRYLIFLILIPLAMVMGLNMLMTYLRQTDEAAAGNLILLSLLLCGAFLGVQLFRGRRK